MNGTERNIEIFKPFGEAVELMKKILFQPFDLKKWFVIGFAAWLANLGSGGGGFNYQFDRREEAQKIHDAISQISHPVLVLGISLLILSLLAVIVLCAWLRARGRFMFIDCIVKNRGAIAEPWREFRKEGNGYFLFWLLIAFVVLLFAALVSLPLIILGIKGHFYYLHRDSLDLFVILAILVVLVIATGLISCFAICATCCVAAIPYIGTVILLPVFVLLQAFSLSFLRQFGPDYDVWTSSMPPESLPIHSGAPPTPPEPPLPPAV